MKDANLKSLVQFLDRTFPKLKMIYPSFLFNDEKDCAPDRQIDWYEFLETLDKNGYEVKKKK